MPHRSRDECRIRTSLRTKRPLRSTIKHTGTERFEWRALFSESGAVARLTTPSAPAPRATASPITPSHPCNRGCQRLGLSMRAPLRGAWRTAGCAPGPAPACCSRCLLETQSMARAEGTRPVVRHPSRFQSAPPHQRAARRREHALRSDFDQLRRHCRHAVITGTAAAPGHLEAGPGSRRVVAGVPRAHPAGRASPGAR